MAYDFLDIKDGAKEKTPEFIFKGFRVTVGSGVINFVETSFSNLLPRG